MPPTLVQNELISIDLLQPSSFAFRQVGALKSSFQRACDVSGFVYRFAIASHLGFETANYGLSLTLGMGSRSYLMAGFPDRSASFSIPVSISVSVSVPISISTVSAVSRISTVSIISRLLLVGHLADHLLGERMLDDILVAIATPASLFALGSVAIETVSQSRVRMFEGLAAGLAGEGMFESSVGTFRIRIRF